MSGPLAGRTVLVTRPAHQAPGLAERIRAAGGEAYVFPALAIEPVPHTELAASLTALRGADALVFVSPNAARVGMAAIRTAGGLPHAARVFAVGPGTARALADAGVDGVIVGDGQDSEALLALPALQDVAGRQVLIVRGVGGRPLLAATLAARGARVAFLECYRRTCPHGDPAPLLAQWQAGGIDAVTVASAETLHNLAHMLGESGLASLVHTPVFAPHAKITEAARRFGIVRAITTAGGDAGLADGLVNWFRDNDT